MQHDEALPDDGTLPDDQVRPTNTAPSRLRRTLHRLSSPFRTASHLERTASTRSSASESEVTRERVRKRNKKAKSSKSDNGSPDERKKRGFVRRFGSIGRKRGEGSLAASSETSTQSSIARDMEEAVGMKDPQADNVVDDISVEHAVATKPFTKAAWRRNERSVIEKPVEEPSPESAVKRRIAFVAQASACLSEDAGGGLMSLQEAVSAARVSLITPHSRSPSLRSRENDTEEEGYSDAMPPYGDLIEAPSTSGVSNCACALSGGIGCVRKVQSAHESPPCRRPVCSSLTASAAVSGVRVLSSFPQYVFVVSCGLSLTGRHEFREYACALNIIFCTK